MEMKIKLQPIRTPNFILAEGVPQLRQEGCKEGLKWPLSEIPAQTLSDLCDRFRAEVFEKAKKVDPRYTGEG